MEDCIFCKIIKGDIPSTKVYEDEDMVIIKDIAPQAPVHLLLLPKQQQCWIVAMFLLKWAKVFCFFFQYHGQNGQTYAWCTPWMLPLHSDPKAKDS